MEDGGGHGDDTSALADNPQLFLLEAIGVFNDFGWILPIKFVDNRWGNWILHNSSEWQVGEVEAHTVLPREAESVGKPATNQRLESRRIMNHTENGIHLFVDEEGGCLPARLTPQLHLLARWLSQ